MKPIILIPARLASTRLPGKPLALVGGKPMIVQVASRVAAVNLGEVAVACDGETIAEAVRGAGFKAVLTDPALPSGSDRIYAALSAIDPGKKYDVVVNVQGDMPTLDASIIRAGLALLSDPAVDIATLAAPLAAGEKDDPAVVKVVVSRQSPVASENTLLETGDRRLETGRAVSFSRAYAHGAYHHIGIYIYRRAALEKFVSLPPSANERREKLEQLRALDAAMRIDVAIVHTVPLGVDTPEGLEKARRFYEAV